MVSYYTIYHLCEFIIFNCQLTSYERKQFHSRHVFILQSKKNILKINYTYLGCTGVTTSSKVNTSSILELLLVKAENMGA
jgi:hypothetical protein